MKNLNSALLFLCLFYTFLFSQDYQRIIHFDREDYLSPDIPIGKDVNGIQGITAGKNYLVVWNMNEFYIFGISDYLKISTIPTRTSIRQVAILQDKIYVLRRYNDIDIYTARGIYQKIKFFGHVQNYQQLKQLYNLEDPKKTKTGENKRRRKRRPAVNLTKEAPWKPADIRGIHNIHGKIFLNIDWNHLDLDEDFNREKHKDITYLFLKKEVVRNENRFFFNGKFWFLDYPSYENKNLFNLVVLETDMKTSQKYEIIIPNKKDKQLTYEDIIHLDNDYGYFLCHWYYNSNDEVVNSSIVIFDFSNQKIIEEITLPDEPKGGNIFTNSFYYQCYFDFNIYKISYNNDESFDVLKMKVDENGRN